MYVFFFFKQKTAYELRISDWSSDVCSSDLCLCAARRSAAGRGIVLRIEGRRAGGGATGGGPGGFACLEEQRHARFCRAGVRRDLRARRALPADRACRRADRLLRWPRWLRRIQGRRRTRSEEHTSELQSLMRISYAVFCLKQKKN